MLLGIGVWNPTDAIGHWGLKPNGCYWALGYETQRLLETLLLRTLERAPAGFRDSERDRRLWTIGLGQQSTLFQERNDTQWRVMGTRDYQEATCGRLLMKRVESGLKKKNGRRKRPCTAKKPRKRRKRIENVLKKGVWEEKFKIAVANLTAFSFPVWNFF